MRTIKFRGKRIDTGSWVYGHYLTCPLTIENFGIGRLSTPDQKTIHCIADFGGVVFHVDEETISQYTGLSDENGQHIYEGDILKYPVIREWVGEIHYAFQEVTFGIFGNCDSGAGFFGICPKRLIVGNRFENPELLDLIKK